MKTIIEKGENMGEHTHEMPATTSGGGEHGKSMPNAGTGQRDKNHGYGYPLTIDSIDHSMPETGVRDRGNDNKHGHSYPGRPYPGKGGAKNQSPKPTAKHVKTNKHSQ
jgi:hypothetical protein